MSDGYFFAVQKKFFAAFWGGKTGKVRIMQIGEKLKRLRVKNQLTLEELANRSEVTKGFLSQVERNLTSPSIATLGDILEALGTTLGEFFSEDKEEKIVFAASDFFVNIQDDYSISYIVPNAQKNSMEPMLMELKGGGRSEEYGPFEAEEFGYVLQGKVILHYGDRKYTVKKGQSFYFKGDRSHYLSNEWESVAKVIWVSNPPSF